MKNFSVAFSKFEYRFIDWSDIFSFICVYRWPFVIIKLIAKDITLYQHMNFNSQLYKFGNILLKQSSWNISVLILANIIYNTADCTDLVAFQCSINSTSVKEAVVVVWLSNFIYVKHRAFWMEVVFIRFMQQTRNWSTVKWEDWEHVRTI
jgi:hypothetical protein